MKIHGTFRTSDFRQVPVAAAQSISTALPVGIFTMTKVYSGEISGRSVTLFTSAFDHDLGVGSYVAMESFEGSLGDRSGSFNFLHSASTKGHGRASEFFAIVDGSGAGGLAGITGDGGIKIATDGTHHIWFDYDLLP